MITKGVCGDIFTFKGLPGCTVSRTFVTNVLMMTYIVHKSHQIAVANRSGDETGKKSFIFTYFLYFAL